MLHVSSLHGRTNAWLRDAAGAAARSGRAGPGPRNGGDREESTDFWVRVAPPCRCAPPGGTAWIGRGHCPAARPQSWSASESVRRRKAPQRCVTSRRGRGAARAACAARPAGNWWRGPCSAVERRRAPAARRPRTGAIATARPQLCARTAPSGRIRAGAAADRTSAARRPCLPDACLPLATAC